jgi:hypothetical protein
MSEHITSPAANRSAADRRPLWALLLALLAIPGTTLAWDLPLGGIWIGLPLCVAALWIGVPVRDRVTAKIAIAIAALALLQMVVWTLASIAS